MKCKLLSLLLTGSLILTLAGCGGKEDTSGAENESSAAVQESSTSQEGPESAGSVENTETGVSEETIEQASSEALEPFTAEVLVKEMAAASEGKQMLQVSVSMDMEMSISAQGITVEMAMNSTTDTKASLEPYASYSNTVMTMDMAGQQTTTDSEVYIVMENDTLVSYVHDNSTGQWSRMDSGMGLDDTMVQYTGYDWMEEKTAEELILAKDTQIVGGKETYVLSCTLTGEEMQMALNGMSGLEDMLAENGLGTLDYTALNVPTVYYIDVETYLPVQIEMDIEGMSEMMDRLLSSLTGEAEAGTEADMGIDISKVHAVYSNISYEPVEVPALPEEAVMMAAQSSFNPDQGDGTYIIQESGAVARVTCPEDFTVTDMTYDSLSLEKGDGTQMAAYTMFMGASSEDFVAYVEETDVSDLQAEEMYISHGMGPVIGQFETMELKCQGVNLYYAWAPMGEGWVYVNMADFNGLEIEAAMKPLLDAVEAWQLQ